MERNKKNRTKQITKEMNWTKKSNTLQILKRMIGQSPISTKSGITLISLVVTIIVLLILAGITIQLTLGNTGIIGQAQNAKEKTNEQVATEKMNLKITNSQMDSYAKEQRMPTLQELANDLCEDNEIEYVELESKKLGSLEKIEVGENDSIFTKLKEYPYEFEINASLQLASINGIKVATNNDPTIKESGHDETTGFHYTIFSDKTCIMWQNYIAKDTVSAVTLKFPFEFEEEPCCQLTKTVLNANYNNMICTINTKDVYVDTNCGGSNKCSFSIFVCGKVK